MVHQHVVRNHAVYLASARRNIEIGCYPRDDDRVTAFGRFQTFIDAFGLDWSDTFCQIKSEQLRLGSSYLP